MGRWKQSCGVNRVTIATVLFVSLLIAPTAFAQKLLKVEWKEGRLSVMAEKTALSEILREVARQTGLEVRGLEGLQEEVSVRFVDLPFDEALRKLLDRVNSLIIGESSPQGKPRPVLGVVFERRTALSPEKLKEEPVALWEEQGARLAALTEILDKGGTQAEQALFSAALDPDPSIRELASETLAARNSEEDFQTILKAATAEDALTRLMALQVLSQHETFALPALAEALLDQDREVKGYAMQMLAQKRSPKALEALGQVLHDPNPAFRQYALKFLRQLGDPTSLSYIGLALHDEDEAVRGLAADLLGR